MDAVTLGPLMLSAKVIYLITAVLLFFLGAGFAAKRQARFDTNRWAQHCLWFGLIAGRLAYVTQHFASYQPDLLSVLYFWQPGYSVPAALAAATAVTLYHFYHHKRSLLAALAWLTSCTLVWFALTLSAPLSQHAARSIPPLTLPKLEQNGTTAEAIDLSQQPGGVIINLWASWCPPCRREMPDLVRFASEHPSIQVWLVNQGESPQMVRRFIETSDTPIPENLILLDPNQSLIQSLDGAGLPITVAYKNGQQADGHIGELNHARLREMAEAIVPDAHSSQVRAVSGTDSTRNE